MFSAIMKPENKLIHETGFSYLKLEEVISVKLPKLTRKSAAVQAE